MTPKISLLILTYNSKRFIDALLESILSKTKEEIVNGSYEILIIDNNSTDSTISSAIKYFDDKNLEYDVDKRTGRSIFIYNSGANLGYAKGINRIAEFAKGKILVVINPDAELLTENFVELINEFDKDDKLAIVGLKIVGSDKYPEKTAGKFYNLFTFVLFSLGLETIFNLRFSPSKKENVDFVSGGFVAFDSEKFKHLKGYDEEYFMYIEDMDICYRAKKKGYKVKFIPCATIKHQGQGSSNRTFAIVNIFKGYQLFFKKHGELPLFLVKYLLRIKSGLIITIATIVGNKELANTYKEALKTIK